MIDTYNQHRIDDLVDKVKKLEEIPVYHRIDELSSGLSERMDDVEKEIKILKLVVESRTKTCQNHNERLMKREDLSKHEHHWVNDILDPCIQRCGVLNCFEIRTKPGYHEMRVENARGGGKMRMSYESFKEAIERDGMIVAIPIKELERLKNKGDFWKKSYEELLELKSIRDPLGLNRLSYQEYCDFIDKHGEIFSCTSAEWDKREKKITELTFGNDIRQTTINRLYKEIDEHKKDIKHLASIIDLYRDGTYVADKMKRIKAILEEKP